MSDDIGLPLTTNRSGSWTPQEESEAAAMARRAQNPGEHLDQILQPIKERGIKSVAGLGLERERDRMADLVNIKQADGQANLKKLGAAVQAAVDVSRIAHPQIIAADPKDHKISQGETKRRIQWCVEIALQMRFDVRPKWSLTRICERMPLLLDWKLEGTLEQHLNETRSFFARGKTPAGLTRAMERDS